MNEHTNNSSHRTIETSIKHVNHPFFGKNTFLVEEKYHSGGSSVAFYGLRELMDDNKLRPLFLNKALDTVPGLPEHLSLKEKLAFLQLEVL